MKIKQRFFNEHHQQIRLPLDDSDEVRLSFYFEDGDNWHFQLKLNASKMELRDALLGISNLIDSTIT